MINNPGNTKYLSTYLPSSLADQEAFILGTQTADKVLVALEVNDTYIGNMGLFNIDHLHGHAETGSLIGLPEYQGKGYGTEAKLLLLEFAFNTLGLRKIYSEVIAYNKRSLAYAKRCGYRDEARLKDHFFAGGEYHDKVILSVDRQSWEKVWTPFYNTHQQSIII
jgi:RimJ/RimL family protein N-acetyltransferase